MVSTLRSNLDKWYINNDLYKHIIKKAPSTHKALELNPHLGFL